MIGQDSVLLQEQARAVLAEYATLREEIGRRGRAQLYIVTVSLIAVGSLLGIISSAPNALAPLLLTIPWVLSASGIIWLDHSHGIHLIGLYIREEIEGEKLPRLFGSGIGATIGWETSLHAQRGRAHFLGHIIILLPLVYFLLPSVVTLIAYYLLAFTDATRLPRALEMSLMGMGLILMLALLYSWFRAQAMYEATRLRRGEQ